MQEILNTILYKTLPKYIGQYSFSALYYPVVIGGFDVMRCLGKNSKFLEALSTSDIDLDFVIRPRHDKSVKQYDKAMLQVNAARLQLADHMISDQELQAKIQVHMPGSRLTRDEFQDPTGKVVYRLVLYHHESRYVLIDLSIFSSANASHFGMYNKKSKNPIPYIIYKGVPFATCNYVYYDTLRMLEWSRAQLEVSTLSDKSILFFFNKVLKYVLKYCALHIVLKEKSAKHLHLFDETIKIYQEVKEIPRTLRSRLLELVAGFRSRVPPPHGGASLID